MLTGHTPNIGIHFTRESDRVIIDFTFPINVENIMCGCLSTSKDQSPKEVHEFMELKANSKIELTSIRGTGLFLVPDPRRGIMEFSVILVESISQREAAKRGFNCELYKWIPEEMISKTGVRESLAGCGGYCGPNNPGYVCFGAACFCNIGQCYGSLYEDFHPHVP